MKHILITGVTGNIGEACLDYFLDTTWRVTGVSRAECFETYVSRKLDFFDKFPGLDLTNYTRVHQFVKAQQPFDLVIMAHGIQAPLTLNQDDFFAGYNRIIESNLKSCVYLTHRLVAENKLRENSLIVYCGSIQAQR
jgi:NADP-dependent 3-hydroxy acid dehydrogenase YdfG